jgi:hypothetical protein
MIRSERIARYANQWRQLLVVPEDVAWELSWDLITSLAEGGDAGVADQVQALGNAPAAVIALALRVPQNALAEALALDVVAPFFWPAVPVTCFVEAIQTDHRRRHRRLIRAGFEPNEATEESHNALARRIEAILVSRPELAGHFGAALVEAHLVNVAVALNQCPSIPSLFIANPAQRLQELGQEAARRFDRLPSGINGVVPRHRPPGMNFNRYAQPMIDAPVVAAEFAVGRRPPASVRELLTLINLRLVDHLYFDASLPAAVALVLKENAA